MAATALRRRAAFERSGSAIGQDVDQRFQTVGESVAHHLAAARRVGAERREHATLARLVAMPRLTDNA